MKQTNKKMQNLLATASLFAFSGSHINAHERPNVVII
jgi:hypothetical protein